MITLVALIGWLAFALNLLGNQLLVKKRVAGWPVRLCANAAWIAYSFNVFAWPLFFNHVAFSLSNAHGWWEWTRRPAAPKKCCCPGCVANEGGT